MKIKYIFPFTFFILLSFFISDIFAKNILILNSYHQTLSWTDSLVKNITSSLSSDEFYIEYMDTKRFNRKKIFKIFQKYIKEKYKERKIDIIIVTDNNALIFAVNNREKLFKNIPIVFCGINNFSHKMLRGYKNITGVIEDVDIKGTLDGILHIYPHIKNIIAIMGANFTSQIYFYKVLKLQYEYRYKVNIRIYNGLFYNYEDYTKELRNIPKNSVILYLNLFRLRDGTIFNIKDSINYVFNTTHKPIFSMWDVIINHTGVVGGKITSSRLQAKYVVNYVKKILYNKIPAEKLPVITKSPSEYIFDYKELKRFNIALNSLPRPYKLINELPKVYKKLREKEKILFFLESFLIIFGVLILLLAYNIYRRKRAEEQIESENIQFLTLLNGTNDVIVLKAPDGTWIYANDTAIKFFNISNVDYRGKTTDELLEYSDFKDDILASYLKDEEIWQERMPVRKVFPFRKKNGEIIYLDLVKIPVFNNDGSRRCIISSGRDVTELKKIQENLAITQKMDMIGKLAGGIAHDFNNILTAITTNAELSLLLVNNNQKLKKYIENISSASEKAAGLIRHLLLFGKKHLGNKSIIEVNSSIKSIIKILKPSIPENIKFIFESCDELISIEADSLQIEQIITNLVFNAKDSVLEKKTDSKIIKVFIDKVVIDKEFLNIYKQNALEGEYVLIAVEDNGIGIDDNIKHKIFDPFFTTKEKGKGTGLGLTTVFNLVNENNGFLLLDTIPGKGSIFKIYFPIEKQIATIEHKNEINLFALNKKVDLNVLFVEDNIYILNSIDEKFKNIFNKFYIAENGRDALNKIKGNEKDIHVLITDIVMPEMDGIELAKELIRINKNLKIIFVSGYDSGKLKEKLNFNYKFLYKPYNFNTLLQIINELFSKED